LRSFATTAAVSPEDLFLDLPELPIPSHGALDAGVDCEEQGQPLPWLSIEPSPIYHGPTSSFPLTIHCLLFPNCEDCFFVEWRGPDLLSPLTYSEDVFGFLRSTLPGGPVRWLSTRLSITSRFSGQTVVDLPFTISPSNWSADSLSRFQLHVYDALLHWVSYWCRDASFDQFVVQLAIWPWRDRQQRGGIEHMEKNYSEISPLDPGFFVHNIISNF
jgi:hypothetical protein